MLDRRELDKLLNSFIDTLPNKVNVDNRIQSDEGISQHNNSLASVGEVENLLKNVMEQYLLILAQNILIIQAIFVLLHILYNCCLFLLIMEVLLFLMHITHILKMC